MGVHLPIFMMSLILFCAVGELWASTTSDEEYWNKVLGNTPMPYPLKNSLQYNSKDDKKPDAYRVSGIPSTINGNRNWRSIQTHNIAYKHSVKGKTKTTVASTNVYFRETQLVIGATMKLPLTNTESESQSKATFLPQKDIDSIPFSSEKLPEILNRFSVLPKSNEATAMEETIRECENAKNGLTADNAHCATSLQEMVSFVKSVLGDGRIYAVSSPPTTTTTNTKMEYKVNGVKLLSDYGTIVACHKQAYPYAIYYCHVSKNSGAYMVSPSKIDNKLVVCHKDTSWWDSDIEALKVLKGKPGMTVCHFLSDLTVVWARK